MILFPRRTPDVQMLEFPLFPSPSESGLTTNPALHAAPSQTTEADPTSEKPDNGDGDDLYQDADVYDDCDILLAVVSQHLLSGGSSIRGFQN